MSDGAVGGLRAPNPPPISRSSRLFDNVWAPVALRAFGAAALLLGLAGVGVFSLRNNAHGAPLSRGEPALAVDGASHGAVAAHPEPAAGVEAPLHADLASASAGAAAPVQAAAGKGEAAAFADAKAEPPPAPGITRDGKVILNTASAEELDRLPGVGAVRARAIVELRTKLKKFRRATDLLRVRGIGRKSLERMLPYLVVDPEPPPPPSAPPTPEVPAP